MNRKGNKELIISSYCKYTDKKYNFLNRFITKLKKPAFKYIYEYRKAQYYREHKFFFISYIYHLLKLNKLRNRMGIYIGLNSKIGKGFFIGHPTSIVISGGAKLGDNVRLLQCTTIGDNIHKKLNGRCAPIIGNNVDIGANVSIIGPVNIGDNSVIGAGSVVVKDVNANCVVAGNPAQVIKISKKGVLNDESNANW